MIPHDNLDGQMLYTIIENIFSMLHVGKLLRKADAGENRKNVFIADDTLLVGLMAILCSIHISCGKFKKYINHTGKLIFAKSGTRRPGGCRLTENGGEQRKLEWPPDRIVKLA